MTIDENHPLLLAMLAELYRQTGGNLSASASMYDLGAASGIDRQEAQEIGQALIGAGLAAIVSLSGKIGITAEGIASIQSQGLEPSADVRAIRLGQRPVIDSPARDAIDALVAHIKADTTNQRWAYDRLAEMMADLRTIEAQLSSPRPKSAILRECLRSVRALLDSNDARKEIPRIDVLIG
jgi:hypothetical protein